MQPIALIFCLHGSHALLSGLTKQPVQPPRAAVRATFSDDMRAIGVATLASLALVVSPMPALAKGGGGGGGGGGHSSHHSSYRSSSPRRTTLSPYHGYQRRSPSSKRSSTRRISGYSSSHGYSSRASASPPPPPPVLLFPDEATARAHDGGYFCPASLPKPGERVDVAGGPTGTSRSPESATVISSTPATQALLYGTTGEAVEAVPGFESECTVTVRYDDGTIGVTSAAKPPRTRVEQTVETVVDIGALLVYPLIALIDGGDSWGAAEERHDELLDQLKSAKPHRSADGSADRPASAEYWGSSEESDEGDQAVRSTISFHRDGSITGWGVDGVDGAYRITRGRWAVLDRDGNRDSRPTVAWIEEYDQGFQVAVEGKYSAKDGKIRARFTSSRGVTGSFELAPKPSVF